MAATVALNTTLPQRAQVRVAQPMLVRVTIDANSETYTSASGGLPFDLFTFLASVSPMWGSISYKDIVALTGVTAAGYTVGQFAIGTPTATTLPCTCKLWNGTTEFSNGACTQVIEGLLWVNRG